MTNSNNSQQQVCLHCMSSHVIGGRCRRCGKANTDEGRPPSALPFGYKLYTPRQRCYQVGRVLGNGGFGITYLAWDQQARRPVALKELFPNKFSRNSLTMAIQIAPENATMFQHFRKRFVDEARIISFLQNEPDIIDIYDYFETNGTGYYTMEYLHGMDMQNWIKQKQAPLTWEELKKPLSQVLHSLSVLHGRELIHRDISPDNIFMCRDGTAKLIDFGSVRNQNADHFTTILKKGYAPPEQLISDGNQGPWTDTFSLSMTIYYLLSAEHPVSAHERVASLKTKGIDPLVALGQYKPEAPERIIRATMYGLNLDENRRFRSADEMWKAFFREEAKLERARGSVLKCVRGVFAGKSYPLASGAYIYIGRGEGSNITYPMHTPAVSRRHCVLYYHANGKLYIMDQNARYGTFIGQRKIPPMEWIEVPRGESIIIGREIFVYEAP